MNIWRSSYSKSNVNLCIHFSQNRSHFKWNKPSTYCFVWNYENCLTSLKKKLTNSNELINSLCFSYPQLNSNSFSKVSQLNSICSIPLELAPCLQAAQQRGFIGNIISGSYNTMYGITNIFMGKWSWVTVWTF